MSARQADVAVELSRRIGEFRHNPLGYVLFNFPWGVVGTPLEGKQLRGWQREFLESVGERLRSGAVEAGEVIRMARASGHGIGKSALVAMLIKWAFDTVIDTRGVVTANTENQLRTKTWAELAKWHAISLTRDWASLTATALISTAPGHDKTWRIDAVPWSEHNTEAFAGLHNEGKRLILLLDEASAIPDKIWEVAEGALTDEGTEIIWCVFGNPTRNTGRFRECFRRFKANWIGEQIDSRTVEGVNLVELQRMVDDYGEDSDIVKVRIRGLFPSMSARQFIGENDVDAAYGRHLRPEQYEWAPKIITVDPAWEGDDAMVIALRQGLMFKVLRSLPKNDNDVVVGNLLARLEDEERADAVFIDGGYGTGIVSVGRTLNRDWQLVWFSEKSNDPGCLNKRAEMWGAIKKWLKEGGAIPEDPGLRDELLAPEALPRLDGKIVLESKKDMKARGLPSPNKADALALSFAYPVQAKPRHPDGSPIARNSGSYAKSGKAGEVYNPMG